jgi:hypothetical protein
MAKEDEEGSSIRDSWFTGGQTVCPVCSTIVRGDEDVVDAHVDACLAHASRTQEEVRQRELQHQRAMEEDVWEDESLGNYVGDLRGSLFISGTRTIKS